MGFQVRTGGSFPDGVGNRLIQFPDASYLELLYFTKTKQELTGEALEEYSFTERSGGGANSFALAVEDPDQTRKYVARRGFALKDDNPLTYDPDGDGPRSPSVLWRTVEFSKPPLASSNLFFIRYSLPARSEERAGDEAVLSKHANGAVGLSAVWLLSADTSADRAGLNRLGFRAGAPVHLPNIKAKGLRYDTAREAIILLQPDGPGPAADALSARGPHVYGVSIAVTDLGRAQRILQRGYGRPLKRYQGAMGEAISAPSRDEVGLTIELHQARATGDP
jgi:hypothetical protein